MPSLSFQQIASMVGGEVISGAERIADSVVIDSREARPGSVFFAIRGDRLDGHDFLAPALEKAEGAVVSRLPHPLPEGKGLVRVDDTTEALQALARGVRHSYPFTLVAITGSAGKTTTKEMIASLLSTERRTWKSWGNFNNQIGCPLCIANAPDDSELVVSEMGMNHEGELEMMSRLFVPDVSVYTNIGPVHLEFFESIDAIAAAKRELLENMRADGTLVLNADDARVMRISEGFAGMRVTYGIDRPADFRARDITALGLLGTRFILEGEATSRSVTLALPGRHNLENLLAAVATARALGISWKGIEEGIATLAPAKHRGVVLHLRGATIYDDSYNSNPAALRKTIDLLAGAEWSGRRIAVIGDMLELGPRELEFHREIGRAIPRCIDTIVAVGKRAVSVLEGAREAGYEESNLHHFDEAAGAANFLKDYMQEGDLILLKGSRGVGLDRVISQLESEG